MKNNTLLPLLEENPFSMSIKELEQRLDEMPDWDTDRKKLVENRPFNQQYEDQLIISTGTIDYRETPYFLKNGDWVQIVNDSGWLNMGWDQPVNPRGHFRDGAVYGPSDSSFTVSDANKYCFIGGTKTYWFKNERVSNWGASITTDDSWGWSVKLNTSYFHYAFNDIDTNQTGGPHKVTLRVWRERALFEAIRAARIIAR